MANNNDYFGLSRVLSLILAIIPVTAAICGIVTRFMEGKNIAAIVRLIINITGVGTIILWVLDLYSMVTKNKIFAFQELI